MSLPSFVFCLERLCVAVLEETPVEDRSWIRELVLVLIRVYDSFCLFTCMPEYVVGEVLLAAKALAADLATERRLVGVGAHMVG